MRTKEEHIMQLVPTGATYTVDLYEFHELADDVKERLAREYLEANAEWIACEFRDFQEHEIWKCVRDLENSIRGARVKWSYNRWYSADFDTEYRYDDCYTPCELEPIENNGYYASFDICDAWNKHTRKLNALNYWGEHVNGLMTKFDTFDRSYNYVPYNQAFYDRLEAISDRITGLWYAELEAACADVAYTITGLLAGEWEDVNSLEYTLMRLEDDAEAGYECRTCEYPSFYTNGYTGRIFYHDSRKWYTADGELYEQADINHACVSIVKVA